MSRPVNVIQALFSTVSSFLRCLGLTIAVVLLLAFVERPSSLSRSSDPRRRSTHLNPPCGATEAVELLCLFIFCLDLAVKVKRGMGILFTSIVVVFCNQKCKVSSNSSCLDWTPRVTWLVGMSSERTSGSSATRWLLWRPSSTGCCLSAWSVMRWDCSLIPTWRSHWHALHATKRRNKTLQHNPEFFPDFIRYISKFWHKQTLHFGVKCWSKP